MALHRGLSTHGGACPQRPLSLTRSWSSLYIAHVRCRPPLPGCNVGGPDESQPGDETPQHLSTPSGDRRGKRFGLDHGRPWYFGRGLSREAGNCA